VGRLADRDLVDPIADAGDHDAQQLGEPIDPRAEERRATSLARVDQSLAIRPEPPPLMNAAVETTFTPASRIRTSSSIDGHMGL
jgi:hypothetical protein